MAFYSLYTVQMPNPSSFLDPNIVMFGKLLLAMILGGIVGTERAVLAKQAAGTRTFGLVALGACLFIVTSNFVNSAYVGIVTFDPLRMAAATFWKAPAIRARTAATLAGVKLAVTEPSSRQ